MIASLSLLPFASNVGIVLQQSHTIAICYCLGFPSPAINFECSAPFEGQFDWRTCDGDIAEVMVESAQLNSTLRTRQPFPFGSLFRCVCNNSIGVAVSESVELIFPSIQFTFLTWFYGIFFVFMSFSLILSSFMEDEWKNERRNVGKWGQLLPLQSVIFAGQNVSCHY